MVKTDNSIKIKFFLRFAFSIMFFFCLNLRVFAKDNIGFACGYEGERTESVVLVDSLMLNKNYEKLRSLLTSNDNGIKCLTVIVCEILDAKGKIKLTEKEKTIIKKAYDSKNKIAFCSGCTYYTKTQLTEVLNERKIDNFGINIKEIVIDRYNKMID